MYDYNIMSDNNKDIYNERNITPQFIYDSYNNLVFSDDTKVIQKMITKINLYNQIKHLNGDILEFGVFKGASLALWLQLIKMYEYHSLTSVIGFDYFDSSETLESLDNKNKELMGYVLNRTDDLNDLTMESISNKCEKSND